LNDSAIVISFLLSLFLCRYSPYRNIRKGCAESGESSSNSQCDIAWICPAGLSALSSRYHPIIGENRHISGQRARKKVRVIDTLCRLDKARFSRFVRSALMSRVVIPALAIVMLSGCSIIDRVDTTIAELGTANHLLFQTNNQVGTVSKQMGETQALIAESNRLVVESTQQVALSIKNVAQSNAKMDVSTANMAKSIASMELTNENMTKTLAAMAETNKNVARSNELMTEMIKTMQRIPGLKP
jgi:methyl-accepting chemotaxis protein